MSIRNLGEMGINLQKIVNRLMHNDNLVKLLYYTNQDPLQEPALTDEEKVKKIYQNLIKIIPYQVAREDNCCTVYIYVVRGQKLPGNNEFRNIQILVDCIVPLNQWIIKDSNLRPFAILGEIQKSLDGKTINGFGQLESGDFELLDLTEENSVFRMYFNLTVYD